MATQDRWAMRWLPMQALEPRMLLSADLVVESVVAPTAAELGSVIEVSWVIRNAGDAATTSEFGWSDGLYLSTDGQIGADDLFLGEYFAERGTPLAPGEMFAMTVAVVLPLDGWTSAGEYRIIVSADVGQWEPEADEGNNAQVSGAMGVTVPVLPDLTVGRVEAAAVGQFGESLAISWTITNVGDGATFGEWTDAVYLSADDVLDPSDLWVDIVEATLPSGPLGAGASLEVQATARLPIDSNFGAGSYRLIVVADGYSMHAESDEENNALASAVIDVTQAPPADLIVENVVSVATGEFGDAVTLSWTVRNVGDGSAMWWGDEVYLSADAILDPSDLILTNMDGTASLGDPLAPGEAAEFQMTVRLPAAGAAPAGTYHLLVQTDAWSSVAESDETNNTGAGGPIAILDPTASDLVVESGVAPETGELGQSVEFSWVVRNQGAGAASTWGWNDGVYLSLDGSLGSDDVRIGWSDAAWLGALRVGPGESLAGGTSAWLPQDGTLQPGVYQVIISADVDGQVLDANRGNNTLVVSTIEITGQVLGPPELGPGGGGPEAVMGDGTFRGLNTAEPEAPVATGQATIDLAMAGSERAGDEGSALFTWAGREAAQGRAGGLSKFALRVATAPMTTVVRASFMR